MHSENKPRSRLLCLDALRGFDMIWILGAEGLFSGLFVATGWSVFQRLAEQFEHSEWHGFTFYDLIFPLFIFISGVTLGISRRTLIGVSKTQRLPVYRKAAVRLLWLFVLGIIYNHAWGQGLPSDLGQIRYASVLSRIGIAWFFSAMIVWHCHSRIQWIIAASILIGYWILLSYVPTPNGGIGQLTIGRSWNSWIDQHFLPGITYRHLATDPEGLLSNLPAIVNGLAGVWAGQMLTRLDWSETKRIAIIMSASLGCLLLGYLWSLVFPINKSLWTSSFVLVTVGCSGLLLAIFYLAIDDFQMKKSGFFLGVVGMNAILLYMLSSLFDWHYFVSSLFGNSILSIAKPWQAFSATVLLITSQWFLAVWLFRRKIFFKI